MFSGIPAETPLDLRFWLFGVHVRVHPMHWLVSALLGWDLSRGNLAYLGLWVVCVFLSVLVHEMGHVLMGRLFGSHGNIVLFSFGGLAIGASDLGRRWQRLLVYVAGPLIQFVLLGLVLVADLTLVPLVQGTWQEPVAELVFMLALINFIWPVFNLLPIWPLDGGKVCRELLEGALGHRGVVASLWLSALLAGFLAVQVLLNAYGPKHELIPYVSRWVGTSMFNALFFALFAVGSFQALQIENQRHNRWDDELPWER